MTFEMIVTVGVSSAGITLLDYSFFKPYWYPVIMVLSLCLYVYFAMYSKARGKYPALIALIVFGLSLLFTLDKILKLSLGWCIVVDIIAVSAMLGLTFCNISTEINNDET